MWMHPTGKKAIDWMTVDKMIVVEKALRPLHLFGCQYDSHWQKLKWIQLLLWCSFSMWMHPTSEKAIDEMTVDKMIVIENALRPAILLG